MLVIPEERAGGEELRKTMEEQEVTHALIVPSVLGGMEDRGLEALETLIVGGEACGGEVVERWSEGRRMINAYGPTEATAPESPTKPAFPPTAFRPSILPPQRPGFPWSSARVAPAWP